MKMILIALFTLVLLTTAGLAEDKKYRVEINVVYNALERNEAQRVIEKAMLEHDGACKVSVEMKNVDIQDVTSWTVTDSDANIITNYSILLDE
jgi:hypothetical protein